MKDVLGAVWMHVVLIICLSISVMHLSGGQRVPMMRGPPPQGMMAPPLPRPPPPPPMMMAPPMAGPPQHPMGPIGPPMGPMNPVTPVRALFTLHKTLALLTLKKKKHTKKNLELVLVSSQ